MFFLNKFIHNNNSLETDKKSIELTQDNYKKVSIVIPTYNRAHTLKKSLDSVLNQSYDFFEIIVVDDCSTDGTFELVNNYNDSRIKYIRLKENSGSCVARNVGIKNASGYYIAFQDSDDIWHHDKLETQIKNLIKNNSDIDFCSFNVFDEKSIRIVPDKNDQKSINKYGILKALCSNSFISTQTIIGKKYCFDKILFDQSLPRLQDYDLVLRLMKFFEFSHTNTPLVDVYIQDDSISKNTQKLINACEIMLNKNYDFNKKETNILKSNLYKILGDSYRGVNNKKSIDHYCSSLKHHFSVKILIKYIYLKYFNKHV